MRFVLKAVPERAKSIKEIRAAIPGLIIVFDQHRDAMDTFCRGLEASEDKPTVYLEDDIILCPNFVDRVMAVAGSYPKYPIQFFSRSKYDLTQGSRWRPGSSFLMCQCHYMPAGMSSLLLQYREGWDMENHPNGVDFMTARFFASRKIRYWNHVPSLVQHRDGPSAIDPRRAHVRQSPTFGMPE